MDMNDSIRGIFIESKDNAYSTVIQKSDTSLTRCNKRIYIYLISQISKKSFHIF